MALNTKGATLSLKTAMAEFVLTEDDLRALPCQMRSCHGNPFLIFRREDVLHLVEAKRASDSSDRKTLDLAKTTQVKKDAKAALVEASKQIEHWTAQKRIAEETLRLRAQEQSSEWQEEGI